MKKHLVEFYSPGTFVSETTEKEIESWDIQTAMSMARTIKERHGAVPYGFCFNTRERKESELDSKVIKTSNMYYLGGKVETLKEVKARANENDRILISNMEGNGWDQIITNDNSWKITLPLEKDDVVLDWVK